MSERQPREPWVLRPYVPSDEGFCVHTWLLSFARSRYGRAHAAHIEGSPLANEWRARHRSVVMRLLVEAETTLLCDATAPEVIWGFCCTEGDDVIHYALVKRQWHRGGLAPELFRAMLGSRYARAQRVTHELVDMAGPEIEATPARIPDAWRFDPYVLARRAA